MTTPRIAAMKAGIFLALALPAFPNISYGDAPRPDKSWPKVECVPLEMLNSEIRWCTDNAKAVAYAEECTKKMAEAWDSASKELRQLQGGGGSQSADFKRSGAKYQATIDKMAFLTGQLMRNANLLARYPEVMADYPGRTGAADSLPCYQNAFRKIQQLVLDLDKRSREGVDALVATSDLLDNVASRTAAIESDSLVKKVAEKHAPAAERLPASVKQKNGTSDITGTEKKKEKL